MVTIFFLFLFIQTFIFQSKSVENLTEKSDESLIRPQSLLFEEQKTKQFDNLSTNISIENKLNSLRKTKSLYNVDQQELILPLNKSRTNLNNQQIHIIEHFLKVNFFCFLLFI